MILLPKTQYTNEKKLIKSGNLRNKKYVLQSQISGKNFVFEASFS